MTTNLVIADRIPLSLRREIRTLAGEHSRTPIHVVAEPGGPRVEGEPYHWVTPSGEPIRYPGAYRRAWGEPVYVASTRRLVVGVDWVVARLAGAAL